MSVDYQKQASKNPAKWAEAKARVAEIKGRGESQFTDEDWLEVKRIYGQSMSKSEKSLEKIMGLSHSMSSPGSLVGEAATTEENVKSKAKQLADKIKKKGKLNKSDYAKVLLIKSMIEQLIKNDKHIWDMEHVLDGSEDKDDAHTDMSGDKIDNNMLISQLESISHHVKEIQEHLRENEIAPDWVKAKVSTAADKLSDVAHYIMGFNESRGDELGKTDEESPKASLSSPEALKAAHGRKVFVYFNLHKKVWSVKDHKTGKVIAHAKKVSVDSPTFKVSEAGRQRVLAEKKKNVHAGVVGTLNAHHDDFSGEGRKRVSYNPYKAGHFYESGTDNPVHSAHHATLHVEEKQTPEGSTARIPHVFAKEPKAE